MPPRLHVSIPGPVLGHRTRPLYSSLTASPHLQVSLSADPGPRARVPPLQISICVTSLVTTPGIRLRAAVTGCLLLDINQGTFLQIWPVSSQLGLQRNDQIKININILPCYSSSNNINPQEMEEGTETFYSLKFKQCRMSAVNAEQASVKFYRKVWNAKIKEQVIQRVECGFLLVHFQWFSIFIMLKFSNEHDQMICRISNCTAHSKLRTSMFSLELWEEVVSTPSNSKRHCIALKTELVTESWWNPEMTKSHRPVRMNVIKFRIKSVFPDENDGACVTVWGWSDVRLISRWRWSRLMLSG